MIRKELRIKLKSDLCVGSGYSFAGIVDSDVCYDECGLPYIPAKRLKGCLREATELIGFTEDERKRLFGVVGMNEIVGCKLSNACLLNYEDIYSELKYMDLELRKHVSPQSVLEQFTVIKAQTKIGENGISKDNALRFTRAIKHYSPLENNQELMFVADVEVEETDVEILEKAVKALRNIGMNRNRGLGSVMCSLEDSTNTHKPVVDLSAITDDEATYVLEYKVKNSAPLVLNVDNDYTTEKYVSGQNVLGYFASAYLKAGNSAEEEEFSELFLKNQVIFSALYPWENTTYYPAPSYINCLKKTKKFVNVSKAIPRTTEDCEEKQLAYEYASANGNQPKKLKGKFVCVKEDGVLMKEVKADIVYHHTKKSNKQDSQDGELLYTFEIVREQQFFAGTITGKGRHIRKLAQFLEAGKMQFGKSKSAQYGTCILVGDAKAKPVNGDAEKFEKGNRILVTLQSDGIFMGESGYAVRCDEVRGILKDTFGIQEPYDVDTLYSELEVRELIGFYGKWNLKRQAIPAVRAGSTFEFLLAEDLSVKEDALYVGERNGEGYGKVIITRNDAEDCSLEEAERIKADCIQVVCAKQICRNILLQEMKDQLKNAALKENIAVRNPSTVGRITLMLAESLDRYPCDMEKAYEDFCERIGSIKDEKKKEQFEGIKNQLVCEDSALIVEKLRYVRYIKPLVSLYEKITGDATEEVKNLWSDYFMSVLVQEKYRQKGRKDDHEEN